MPTAHPRHSITETPALTAALEPLRQRLGSDAPSLTDLVLRGAEVVLRELEARDRARVRSLETFVERMRSGPEPDYAEIHAVRHARRAP